MKTRDELYLEYFNAGILHLENKNFAEAVEAFTRVLAQQETVDALLNRATAYLELNHLELAGIDVEASRSKIKAMRNGNDRPRARTHVTSDIKKLEKMQAEIKSRLEKIKNTLSANLDDFVLIDGNALPAPPKSPNIEAARKLNNHGAEILKKNVDSTVRAITCFTESLENCHSAAGFYNRARAYFLNKDYNLAYEDIKVCLQMPARKLVQLQANILLADILHTLQKPAEAIAQYEIALEFSLEDVKENPDNYQAHSRLGAIYYSLKDYSNSEAAFTQSIACSQQENICGRIIDRAYARVRVGNLIGALSDYRIMIELLDGNRNPRTVQLHKMIIDIGYFSATDEALVPECLLTITQQIYSASFAETMMNLILAYKHNPHHEEVKQKLEATLKILDKNEIVEAIGRQSKALQIELYKQCLDPNTLLGQRIWRKEILTRCKLTTGTLKKIQERLAILQPDAAINALITEAVNEPALIRSGIFAVGALQAREKTKNTEPTCEPRYDGYDQL